MVKRIARGALNFTGSCYYRLLASEPVWRHRNRGARREYLRHPAKLAAAEEAAARSLDEQGIALAHISDFFGPGVFDELSSYVRRRWQDPAVQAEVAPHTAILAGTGPKGGVKKAFLVNLWAGEAAEGPLKPMLDLAHPFTRFSISGPVLRVVNAYLGMFSKFRAWRLEATIPMPSAGRAASSQRWHRDPEDQKLVKAFLYLNDVDPAAGPFMYLRRSHLGGKWRDLFPMTPPAGSPRLPPGANEGELIPKEDVLVSTGRAGTMIFCDTSGLHKGGFALERERLMYTSVHTTGASFSPIRYRYPSGFQLPADLSRDARFALINDPDQREPKYYRS